MQHATPDCSSLYQFEMDQFEPLIWCESARWGSLRQDSSPPKATPYIKSDPAYLPTDSTKGDWLRTTTYVLEEWLPTRRSSYFSHFASANFFVDIAPATLPNGTKDVAYSQTLTATGGTPPRTFTLVSGSLPAETQPFGINPFRHTHHRWHQHRFDWCLVRRWYFWYASIHPNRGAIMKISTKILCGLILLMGVSYTEAALISIEGVIEGPGSGPVGTRGETMDYLKFEVINTSDVRITGTDIGANILLILAGYTGRDDRFEFVGNPYELVDNYPNPSLPFLERQLDAGTYVIVVDSDEDSGYDIWDGFVPVNRGGGGFSIAPYSFEVAGDVRGLEHWEGKFDPTPNGSFDVTAIPEPSSVLLLTFGTGGLLFYRRAKKRQQEQRLNRRAFL